MEETKQTTDQVIHVWTDGACSGNPGPGGWAWLIVWPAELETIQQEMEYSGSSPMTTNNQMELRAVAEVLWDLPDKATAVIHTDSKNVIGWLSLGWKRKNPEIASICAGIDAAVESKELTLKFEHVKGHSGDENNERVNELAQAAVKR